jgi:SAM-dependent methyltransferase
MEMKPQMNRSTNLSSLLRPSPKQFFMAVRDIAFWIRSASADAALARLRREYGARDAMDRLYARMPDPWGSTLPCYRYQRLKYETLISLLPARRYTNVLDLGCGMGGLTRQLSAYADHVLGADLSATAIEQARGLSQDYTNVGFEQADILDLDPQWERRFDFVVLADVLYYLSPLADDNLKSIARRVERLLTPGGLLLLVNHDFYVDFLPGARMTRLIRDAFRWSPSFRLWDERWRPFYLASIFEQCSGLQES